jgi:cytochrome c oxidase subunit 1
MWSSIGAFGFGLSQLLFPYIIYKCVKGGAKATNDVWEGAHGLEWLLPSPPPYHSWETPPRVRFGDEPGEFDPHAARAK